MCNEEQQQGKYQNVTQWFLELRMLLTQAMKMYGSFSVTFNTISRSDIISYLTRLDIWVVIC